MKIFTVLLAIALIAGCEIKGNDGEESNIKELCYDGVTYIHYNAVRQGYLSIKLNTDSKVVLCTN